MEGNEETKPFMQLLEQVKDLSDNVSVSSHTLSCPNNEPNRLGNLQRQAHTIQEILARLPTPVTTPEMHRVSSPQPHEIYQNLGPLMGSGLRQLPPLPPKEQGKFF